MCVKSYLYRYGGGVFSDHFEIEQEDGDKKYGKGKEHQTNPIIQMELFTDSDNKGETHD